MQAQCDACHTKPASVFCSMEELVLCGPCDHQLHHDNPLVRDHQRVSFFYPVPKEISICDICQETKAFIFCREHRAILCRKCDISMHSSEEIFMKKHNRFILTGAKLCPSRDSGDEDRYSAGSPVISVGNQQLELESGGSTSNPEQLMPAELMPQPHDHGVDMSNDDDPYGLCKQKGEGSGFAFEDTDLGCFFSSLSPKRF